MGEVGFTPHFSEETFIKEMRLFYILLYNKRLTKRKSRIDNGDRNERNSLVCFVSTIASNNFTTKVKRFFVLTHFLETIFVSGEINYSVSSREKL